MIISHLKKLTSPASPCLVLCLCLLAVRFAPTQGLSVLGTKLKSGIKDLKKSNNIMTHFRQALQTQNFDPLSPQRSWFLFNENDAHNRKKNKKRKCKKCGKLIPMPKQGPEGPPGPRGPPGPQGLSGGTLSLKEIENYIQVYLADLLLQNKTLNSNFLVKRRRSPFKEDIPVVFTAQLYRKEAISAMKASVVRGLTVTFGPGQFKRGVLINRGKFTVLMSGVYQVSGTLPLQRKEPPESKALQEKDGEEKSVSLYLCVDNCYADRRLRWSGSMKKRDTTAVVSGHVRLKRGQTIMLLLSNPTRSTVEILPGSSFSASLIGT